MHRQIAGRLTTTRTKWVSLVAWLLLFFVVGGLSAKLIDVQNNEASSWLPESAEQNDAITAAAGAATGRLAAGPCTVVYDGIVGPWYLPLFLQHTGLASLAYAVLLPPVEQCIEGVLGRTGHGFADARKRQQGEAAEAARMILNEPGEILVALARDLNGERHVAEVGAGRCDRIDRNRDAGLIHQFELGADAPIGPWVLAAAQDADPGHGPLVELRDRVLMGVYQGAVIHDGNVQVSRYP